MRKNDIFAAINNTNMGSWTIYNKSGVAKAVVKELELHDEWMAECYLTITVKSAQPISFAVGDYIDYRNERYTIEYDPNEIKKSASGTYGEGFVYENIKFVGAQDDVVRCDFNDIVLSDNNVHYTALPTFPFYCESVDDLLDRIQANLEDLYPNGWIVIGLNTVRNYQRGNIVGRAAAFEAAYRQWVDPDLTPRTDPYGKQSVAETADNITCWDALTKVHDDFGLNFIVRGKVIIVGTAGVFTANTFRYGKGNGLSEIEKLGDSSQQIVTRLRAYGSETNMPLHYYSAINMLPYGLAVDSTTDGNVQIDVEFKKEYFVHEFSSGETDVVAKVGDISYNAKAYINSSTGKINLNLRVAVSVTANAKVYITEGVKRDMWPSDHKDYAQGALPENMAVSRLMLPMFPNQSLYDWVKAHRDTGTTYDDATGRATYHGYTAYFSKEPQRPYIDSLNKDDYGIRPASIYFDGSNDTVDIHPTIEGMTYNSNPIDVIFDAEHIDDNGVYDDSSVTVPNFNITLPNLGFNLAEVYEENASIDVKDGMCGGRSFKIASKPTQDANGRWVCECQRAKDDSLSLFFPYNDFQIASGDHYVLTGIQLPDEYISAASVRMVDATLDALFKNHAPRLTYQPKIDYNFMQRQHDTAMASQGVVSLHDTLKAGDVFVFADADMGIDKSVIIDQLTIKENGEKGIPTYEISLRDEKDVSPIQKLQNKIDSVISGAININSGVAGLTAQQVRSLINNFGGAQFLSKLNDDTAAGYITMLKGLQIGANFVPDILGEGGVLRMREDGKVELVTDILYARVKAYFDSVEIREYQHTGGNRIASIAGNKICRVAWYNSSNVELEQTQANLSSVAYFRCYFRASDGEDTVKNNWVVGDQAYCHITSVTTSSDNPEQKGLNQKHLWRLVIGRNTEGTLTEDGEAYIDLSNRATETISGNSYTGYQSGSDIPEAQDDIIQLGNVNDTTRQGAIVEFVTGTDAPSYQIYQGINSFSLNGKNQITIGYNTATGKADMKVYGDAYIGARDRSTFIEFKQDDGTEQHNPALNIKAHVEFTNSNQELDNLVQSHQRDDSYDDTEVRGLIDGLQDQIDGQIESWFYNYAPVAVDSQGAPTSNVPSNVEPYKSWNDADVAAGNDAQKIAHLGDTFTNNKTGYCWRFTRNSSTNAFEWTIIQDSAVITALQNAAKAQDTADHKRRVFLTQPVPPYDAGDMWVNAVYPANYTGVTDEANHNYNNDILKCVTAKASDGSFSINDWALASKYTDDSKFNGYISALLNNTGLSGDSAAAAVQNAILGALGVGTVVAGGLLLTSLIGMRQYNGSGDKSDVSNYTTWAGISGQYNANVLGGGMAAWYGGGMLDKETLTTQQISQGWSTLRWAKGVDRFDGSGYRADGNISWNANGALTIKNITTLSDSNNKNILNELATFNSAFTFGTDGEGSTTALYITPQVPFKELYIGTSNANKQEVATKNWVNQNFVTTTFFDNLFRLYNGTESASNKIAVNGTLPTDKTNLNIEAMFGFWTKKYISALGQGDDGSTSYTTLAQLNDVTLTNPTTNQILVYDGTHWRNQNQQSVYELPVATTTTLGGIKVGTTLAISSGVLNLPTTGVTAGTYKRVTVDAYGRVTSGDNTDTDTWRGVYVDGVSKVGTGVNTKAINFKAGSNVSISFAAAGTGSGQSTSDDYFNIVISATDTTYSAATQSVAGLMSAADKKKLDGVAEGANNYSLPLATSGTRGGVKIGYSESNSGTSTGRNYAVQLSSEKMFVNVPWENTWRGIQNNLTSTSTTDSLSAAQGKALKGYIDTLNGYFSNGVAKSAAKLTTVSKTLFGNTYWTSDGVPASIGVSGSNASLSYVQNISMSGYIKIGDAYLTYDSNNNAIRVSANANGTGAVNFYAVGGVSALGETADGQAGVGDVTWALLADGTDTRQIALSHLTTSLTTITGGTTDATNKRYAVYKNSSNQLFVDVPWVSGSASDTKNTAGGDNTTSKIFLVGMTAQTSSNGSARTYTNVNCYASGGYLYSGGAKVLTSYTEQYTGTVTSVKVGTTSYTPTNGVISLPAYPTVPTKVSQLTNDSGYITSYTNTWRNIYVSGTEKLTTAITTKGLNFAAGSNVSLSFTAAGSGAGQNANYGTITISATDTTYESKAAASGGTAVSLVTTGEKYTWNSKAAGNHTHTTSIATSTAANQLTLAFGSKYAITAGGTSYVFTMPSNPVTAQTTGFKITAGTTAKTLTVGADYTLGAACAKGVTDNSSATAVTSTDTNLITARTLYYAGYVKSSGVTSITLKAGTGISLDVDNTAITSTGTRTITNAGVRATTINGNYLRVNTNGTNADLTIPYATNADTVDSLHASDFTKFYLSPLEASAPATSAKSWFTETMPNGMGAIVYNVPGSEKTIIVGKSSGAYGHMLQIGYDDNYLRLLRYQAGSWKTTDWEKISAGYADSAGSVDWANVTNHPTAVSSFTNDSGYVTSSGVTSVATGTGLTGGTITGSGTISINSTYQTYISHGESAYNWGNHANAGYASASSLSNYLPLSGGTMTGNLSLSGGNIYIAQGNEMAFTHNSHSRWYIGYLSGGGGYFNLYDQITEKYITIDNSFKVGINTYSPSYQLTVVGTFGVSDKAYFSDKIVLSDATTTGIDFYGGEKIDGYGNFKFGANSQSWGVISGSGTSILTVLNSNGNVGIGDANPVYKLEVGGTSRIGGNLLLQSTNGTYIQVGEIRLMYDSSNNAIKVIKSDGTNANLYATGGISALGAGQESGGGGGGGDVTWSALQSWSDTRKIAGSHLKEAYDVFYVDRYGDYTNIYKQVAIVNGESSSYLEFPNDRKFYFGVRGDANFWVCFNSAHVNSANANYVGIGDLNPAYTLEVAGTVCAITFQNRSDMRLKNVIPEKIALSVSDIANAPAFKYYWKDMERFDHDLHVGTSAQYWQNALKEVVTAAVTKDNELSMNYGVAALISAITVARKVMTHEEKIALLETRVSALEKENGEQEMLINSLQEELAKFKAA